jgi:hypothetical protein
MCGTVLYFYVHYVAVLPKMNLSIASPETVEALLQEFLHVQNSDLVHLLGLPLGTVK